MKKTLCFILIFVLLIAVAGFAGYKIFYTPTLIYCNGLRISKGVYSFYLINEALNMDINDYNSKEEYWEDLRERVWDRISVDAHFDNRANEAGISLTTEEEAKAGIRMVATMRMLGFEYEKHNDNNSVYDYFNATREEIREFFIREARRDKYYRLEITRENQTILTRRDIRRMSNLADRMRAEAAMHRAWDEQRRMQLMVDEFFIENIKDYVSVQMDFIFLEFPKDEEGNIIDERIFEYRMAANSILRQLERNPANFFQLREVFPEHITSASFIYVDRHSNIGYLYGEEFLNACLTAELNSAFRMEVEGGMAVVRIHRIVGREENHDEMAAQIRPGLVANQIRKAVLGEEYIPIIKNEKVFESFNTPRGAVWEKLLEK